MTLTTDTPILFIRILLGGISNKLLKYIVGRLAFRANLWTRGFVHERGFAGNFTINPAC